MQKAFSTYPTFEKDSVRVLARVPKESIADLCRIIEIYEGICLVRTKDPDQGIIEFWVSPSFTQDFQEIIGAIKDEVNIAIIEEEQ